MSVTRRPSLALPRPWLVVTSLLAALSICLSGVAASAATPRTYYVSCAGSDTSTGRSTSTAWRTLARASTAALAPGDRLRLQRGCSFTGPLRTGTKAAPWSGTSSAPITIEAYGTGSRPKVRDADTNFIVTGRYLVFADLWTSSPPTSFDPDPRCAGSPRGNTYGWRLLPGSHHVTIRRSRAVGLYFGVWIDDGSHHDRIIGNDFIDNNVKDPDPASDAGAVGVAILGDDNEVGWNRIEGSDSCSLRYGRDGAAVEVYGGQRNLVHHNVAVDNNAFLEIGRNQQTGKVGKDTTVAYNDVRSRLTIANFLVVRGAGSKYGPTSGTVVRHNSVYLTGAESYALQCTEDCTPDILDFRDNIVWAQDRVGFVDGSWTEARNIWWSPTRPNLWFTIASSSFHADPRFVDAPNDDLHLRATSPALDTGGTPPSMPGGARDLDKRGVPQGARPDIGAYERPD